LSYPHDMIRMMRQMTLSIQAESLRPAGTATNGERRN
jgi:hypothetical protein